MKSSLTFIKSNTDQFFKKWDRTIFLSLFISFYLDIVIFLANFGFHKVMEWNDIPYISYNNLEIFLTKPFALLGFILIFLFIIFSVFIQFSFLIRGISQIDSSTFQISRIIKDTYKSIPRLFGPSAIFLTIYFILVIPFAGTIFKTKLLDKVVIPQFILDFLSNNGWIALGIAVLSIAIAYIGLRLMFVLPLMIMNDMSFTQAMKESLAITKKKFWYYTLRLFIVSAISTIVAVIVYILVYIFQYIEDGLVKPIPLIMGILNLSLVQLVSLFVVLWANYILIQLLLSNEKVKPDALINQKGVKQTRFPRWLVITFVSFTVFFYVVGNWIFLVDTVEHPALNISHRGVDAGYGVQNTIPALEHTIKTAHPDYVEMDIQETSDKKFVVMHDENLRVLTGVNKRPQELTLAELTKLVAKENGSSAPVVSFDDYLKAANSHKQKLLVEIKTTRYDSKDYVSNFVKQYEKELMDNGHEIHSLDYNAVKEVKKNSKLKTYFILPYNFIFPRTDADGYTMEQTTLNESFVDEAHLRKQNVYAWTVNDVDSMKKMALINVDGIITDNSSNLNGVINELKENPKFADKILDYLVSVDLDKSLGN
ncbi:hypothetical protein BG262_01860 [Floricoccus penangensis]|uniref:GP-PDE domain-containing protein n=1 Tax=Floricoccus penangensis TaxID=1859475 RepID=A0A9Q5JHH3_9LACT|nr:glycerophosphodiester phosphodiesterase [Floricoccus penangensis]OFI47096.1 hypothetical protein BG262_01860 [Floricoccus penangensis]